MAERIEFYRVGDAYGEFSNFSPHPIDIDGERYATSEHYFQAMKFEDPSSRERVRAAGGPSDAARLGRGLPGLRSDWDTARDEVMRVALHAKFTQHDRLRRLLVGTGDAELIEHTKNDHYWADGGDGQGRNRLGELLMELRATLQAEDG
ncbi:MAG: NADAR family protein [Myxococcota bacterium]